ncbi:MAG TPA: Tol-Pal system beta propeller repeat protein TolB [Acidobacteriaceae bacterium]|nr:Tol-Pal system beta propeller repeat protein TolB [Acidobacteriaceae bacterium]
MRRIKRVSFLAPRLLLLTLLFLPLGRQADAQDWVRTGTNLGAARIRLAAADFNPGSPDVGPLKSTFDTTLFGDLSNAGIFDMVSKSLAPPLMPGSPQQINLAQWSAPPSNAAFVAFGSISTTGGRLAVYGWLFDAKNPDSPQILGKQYNEAASQENARLIAHRFADEIITRLGGGIPGIAETHIFYVSARGGNKEIWEMDYDGQGAHQVTHLGTISLSPRVSPDNDRIAFASLGRLGWAIRMYSLVLGRLVSFPSMTGNTFSPAWSSNGAKIAFSGSRTGDPEIYTADASGGGVKQITRFRGPDVSPTWNPKTNTQIAWCSGRSGLPQIYIMESDGTNVQRLTDGGYATSPAWSPSGQYIAFAWNRKYGPGAPGGQDIYIMDIASKRWTQLTHDAGRQDFPSWSPDSRHIVFQRENGGGAEIWTMLSDGTEQHRLTPGGGNSMPNWSWK